MSLRLLDTNVVVRVLLGDIKHKQYSLALGYVEDGGLLEDYVIAEIIYVWLKNIKKNDAYAYALSVGELDEFNAKQKEYVFYFIPAAHWKSKAYTLFSIAWKSFIQKYPRVMCVNQDLFNKSLEIAQSTGLDWVDCTLLAERYLRGSYIATIDSGMIKYIKSLKEYEVKDSSTIRDAVAADIDRDAIEILETPDEDDGSLDYLGVGGRNCGVQDLKLVKEQDDIARQKHKTDKD